MHDLLDPGLVAPAHNWRTGSVGVFTQLLAVIFISEIVVMAILSLTNVPGTLINWFIDAIALSILCCPVAYWVVVGPLRRAEKVVRHQRQLAVDELEILKDQLVRQTRLAAIGQVSASIAHELRNPLGSVRNAVYILKRRVPEGQDKWRQYLGIIDEEVSTADRIISELLEMSRLKKLFKCSTDLAEAVREAFDQIEPGNRISCQCRLTPDPFMVSADPSQLRQVLSNLMLNSIEAMNGSGQITVDARRDKKFDIITFRDSGQGIRPDMRKRIFEPLFTMNPTGTGLGLTICRQIIEQHGGTIELTETKSPGTAMMIRLPCHQDNTEGR